MTQPGWYPDQAGGPNMKYWDGHAWHDAIPETPALAASTERRAQALGEPSPAPDPTTPTGKPNKFVVPAVGAGLLAAVIGLVTVGSRNGESHSKTSSAASSAAEVLAQTKETTIDSGLMIDARQVLIDGTTSDAIAGVAVSQLQAVPPRPYFPVRGQLYAAYVYVQVGQGTFTVNPFYFAARTHDGTNLLPRAGAENDMLPATEVPTGQQVSGWLTFDVPTGQHIAEIIMSDPLGKQLGRWLVK